MDFNLGFLIFLGGLQNLPKDVVDASRLDGLGGFRRVFAIDIPLLLPQFRIVVILSGIYAVQKLHRHLRPRPGHVPVRLLQRSVRLRHGHRHPASS